MTGNGYSWALKALKAQNWYLKISYLCEINFLWTLFFKFLKLSKWMSSSKIHFRRPQRPVYIVQDERKSMLIFVAFSSPSNLLPYPFSSQSLKIKFETWIWFIPFRKKKISNPFSWIDSMSNCWLIDKLIDRWLFFFTYDQLSEPFISSRKKKK